MSSKSQEEYILELKNIVEYSGDLPRYNELLFEWVKTGKISHRSFCDLQEYVMNLLLNYH